MGSWDKVERYCKPKLCLLICELCREDLKALRFVTALQNTRNKVMDKLRVVLSLYSGVEKRLTQRPHKSQIVGSNPTPAIRPIVAEVKTKKASGMHDILIPHVVGLVVVKEASVRVVNQTTGF